jgi:nucleotide-binding universal stress UspA family protein
MKTILVPLAQHDRLTPMLEAALILGRNFTSYIEGMALAEPVASFIAADALGATIVYEGAAQHDDEATQELHHRFEDFMQARGVPRQAAGAEPPTYGWCDEATSGDVFVGSYGRVFDITIVGRPGSANGEPRMSTLESALFESGRPILMVPSIVPATIGETVVVAWNGSTETARAVGFAMPILRRARRTVVLSVEGGSVVGPTGDQVVRHLTRNGVASESLNVSPESRSTGEAILAETTRLGADLLIKGAFTQSRLRQMIFGGATRHVISAANLPVFMAH